MWYREEIKEFLDNYISLNGSSVIYLTDLKSVLYVSSEDNIDTEKALQSISKNLLEELLQVDVNLGNEQILMHSKSITPLFEDIAKAIQWDFQMILPVIVDDDVLGALIFVSNKEINDRDIVFAKTILKFIREFILQELKQQFLLRDISSVEIGDLFCDDNLEQIKYLIESNYEIMDKQEIFTATHEELYKLSEYFKSILSKENFEKFQEFEKNMFKISECEAYIAYQIGIKKGVQINKLTIEQ